MCIQYDSSFDEIITFCNEINPFGVITRYPKEKVITELMTRTAIEQAQKVYHFCLAKIP